MNDQIPRQLAAGWFIDRDFRGHVPLLNAGAPPVAAAVAATGRSRDVGERRT